MCFFSENLNGFLLMEFASTPCTKYLECGVLLELIFSKIRHTICNYKHMAPVNVNILETWRDIRTFRRESVSGMFEKFCRALLNIGLHTVSSGGFLFIAYHPLFL